MQFSDIRKAVVGGAVSAGVGLATAIPSITADGVVTPVEIVVTVGVAVGAFIAGFIGVFQTTNSTDPNIIDLSSDGSDITDTEAK